MTEPIGRAAVIRTPGGAEVIEVVERPLPRPAAGQVLVRVHASAMNRADVLQRQGRYPPPPGAPVDVPGLELAGRVHAVGPGISRWREGDRVFGLVSGGAHADFALAAADTLVPIPDRLSWTEAGAIPEAFLTAHDALRQAPMASDETVLVHAAASGVGVAAVQLVRVRQGRALGTSRSADKLARLAEFGLLAGFDASSGLHALPEWTRAHSAGRGADVVLDLVGGDYYAASLRSLALHGRLMLIGTLAGADGATPLGTVLRQRLTIRGTVLRSRGLEERIRDARSFEEEVVPLLRDGIVRPVIDAVYPLDRIGEAHRHVESNATFGKVVVRMTDEP